MTRKITRRSDTTNQPVIPGQTGVSFIDNFMQAKQQQIQQNPLVQEYDQYCPEEMSEGRQPAPVTFPNGETMYFDQFSGSVRIMGQRLKTEHAVALAFLGGCATGYIVPKVIAKAKGKKVTWW